MKKKIYYDINEAIEAIKNSTSAYQNILIEALKNGIWCFKNQKEPIYPYLMIKENLVAMEDQLLLYVNDDKFSIIMHDSSFNKNWWLKKEDVK